MDWGAKIQRLEARRQAESGRLADEVIGAPDGRRLEVYENALKRLARTGHDFCHADRTRIRARFATARQTQPPQKPLAAGSSTPLSPTSTQSPKKTEETEETDLYLWQKLLKISLIVASNFILFFALCYLLYYIYNFIVFYFSLYNLSLILICISAAWVVRRALSREGYFVDPIAGIICILLGLLFFIIQGIPLWVSCFMFFLGFSVILRVYIPMCALAASILFLWATA